MSASHPVRCACLVAVRQGQIMMVRVRDNRLWYLPGGRIEPAERAEDALIREVREELGVELKPRTVEPIFSIRGPDYARKGLVELLCFRATWVGRVGPKAEVSEVAWLGAQDYHLFAPTVQRLYDLGLHLGKGTGQRKSGPR